MFRLLALFWIPFALLKLVLLLAGLVVVPVAIKLNFWGPFWLWGNDEEGCPDWWRQRTKHLHIDPKLKWYERLNYKLQKKFPKWYWYAIRNPVNNLRYLLEDPDGYSIVSNVGYYIEADLLVASGEKVAYRHVWSGWKYGYRRVWVHDSKTYSEVWLGFKVGSSIPGLGFTTQIRLKRPIGT